MQVDLSIACDVTFFVLFCSHFYFVFFFIYILKLHFRISRLFWQSFVLGRFNILFFLSSSLNFFFLFSDVPDYTSLHPSRVIDPSLDMLRPPSASLFLSILFDFNDFSFHLPDAFFCTNITSCLVDLQISTTHMNSFLTGYPRYLASCTVAIEISTNIRLWNQV